MLIFNKNNYININDKIEGEILIKKIIIKKKYSILFLFLIIIIINFIGRNNKNELKKNITKSFSKYILICERKIRLKLIKIYHKFPFISICIPIYNTEHFIERAILSVINQSFQDFEIIIVNDFSNDNTEKIIRKIQLEDNRIKIINHSKNLGVYHSRVEAALNSKGKYILFLDPDDMLLNDNLFKELFNYNKENNFDIIEFLVYEKNEGEKKIYYPEYHIFNHNHNYTTKIIYQPELSDIIFYQPRTKNYTSIICRTIWNKIFKREIQLKTIKYIGNDYYNNYNLIVADDTMMNIINFVFAKNYSNINLPGYLYTIKKASMSRGYIGEKHRIKQNISFLLFFNLIYKYIKDYNKDINFLYYEIKLFGERLIEFKKLKIYKYMNNLKKLFNNIMNDHNSSKILKDLINTTYNRIFN